jgi:hypothetical protein
MAETKQRKSYLHVVITIRSVAKSEDRYVGAREECNPGLF